MSRRRPKSARKSRRGQGWPIEFPDLATYFERSGDSQLNASRVLRVSQGYLSKVAAGRLNPAPEMALRIAAYARIPLDSFIRVSLLRRGAA